ncbi:MAG: hypothetical protein R3F31_19495 [Verrucomicrobiales bacterium]
MTDLVTENVKNVGLGQHYFVSMTIFSGDVDRRLHDKRDMEASREPQIGHLETRKEANKAREPTEK